MTLLVSRKTSTHRELYADKRIINCTTNTIKSNKAVKVFNGENFLVASSGIVGHHVVFEIIDRMISLSIKLNQKNKKVKEAYFLNSFTTSEGSFDYRLLDGLVPIDSATLDSEASLTYIINEVSKSFRQVEIKDSDDKYLGSSILIPKTNNKVFALAIFSYGTFLEEHHDEYHFEGSGLAMANALVVYQRDILGKEDPDIKSVFQVVSKLDGGVSPEIDFYKIENV